MKDTDLAILIGWGLAVVLVAVCARFRKPWIAIAGLILFAVALSALTIDQNRARIAAEENLREIQGQVAGELRAAAAPLPDSMKLEVLTEGFEFPVSMAWDPSSSDIYVTERSGAIRVVTQGELLEGPCEVVPASSTPGQNDGLLGIELSPSFEEDRFLYVFFTDRENEDNRLVRFEVTADHRCVSPEVIIDRLPSGLEHNGGQFAFADGVLYIATGEGGNAARAQDLSDPGGKVLRLHPDGRPTDDNPFPDGDPRVWAYGFRNPFGIEAAPNGQIYGVDNGPFCSDELNLIRPGGNYGWWPGFGADDCGEAGHGTDPIGPLHTWGTTVAPTDLLWYEGRLAEMHGLLMGDFNLGLLHRFTLNTAGDQVISEDTFDLEGYRALDVSLGPGGLPYIVGFKTDQGVIARLAPSR